MGYYDPKTQVRGQAPQMNLSGFNQAATQTQSALANTQRDQQARQLLALKQLQDQRIQDEYDRKASQRSIINDAMTNPDIGYTSLNDNEMQSINNAYDALATKYKGQTIDQPSTAQDSYNRDLESINSKLFAEMRRDKKGVYSTDQHYGTQTQVKDVILKDLLSKDIDYDTANTLATQKAATLVPMLDAKSAEAMRKNNIDMYKLAHPTKGNNGGVSIGADGSISIGNSSKDYRVDTTKNDPKLLQNTIDRIKNSKDFTGGISSALFGEDHPTTDNINRRITALKKEGYSDTQIARGLEAATTENWFTDDTLAPLDKIKSVMGTPGVDSSRARINGGGSSQSAFVDSLVRANDYRNLQAQNDAINRQSNPNFDSGMYGIEHAFDKTPYKAPTASKNLPKKVKTANNKNISPEKVIKESNTKLTKTDTNTSNVPVKKAIEAVAKDRIKSVGTPLLVKALEVIHGDAHEEYKHLKDAVPTEEIKDTIISRFKDAGTPLPFKILKYLFDK